MKSGQKTPDEKAGSPEAIPTQPYLALPTNPIIIIPCSLIQAATVLTVPQTGPSGVSYADSTCFIMQNEGMQPIAQAIAPVTLPDNSSNTSIRPSASKSANSISDHDANSVHNDEPKPAKRKENNLHAR